VEEAWALQLPEKRQEIERKAIALKHNIHLDNVPMRTAPSHLIGPPPLSFTQLESIYFNLAERNFDGVDDTNQKRRHWLAQLGLHDSIYQTMCQTATQTVAVETVYSDKTIPERRAIEAKAKYLKVMLTPVIPSWHGVEKAYEIYPRSAFARHSDYSEKRREWLQLLELDFKPFRYVNLTPSDVDMEAVEVAWSECGEAKRKSVEDKAKMVMGDCNPILHSWDELEEVFGIIKEEERDFKDDPYGYDLKRRGWVQAIGLESEPYFKDQMASPIVRQEAWELINVGKRRAIIRKARVEKERYVRDKARQQAEKKGSNYQAPTSLTTATPKAVSKPRSSGWTSNSRVSKPSKPAKTSSFRQIPRSQWSNWSGRRGPTGGYVTGGKLYAADGRYIRRADY